jgi:hypothetical protein
MHYLPWITYTAMLPAWSSKVRVTTRDKSGRKSSQQHSGRAPAAPAGRLSCSKLSRMPGVTGHAHTAVGPSAFVPMVQLKDSTSHERSCFRDGFHQSRSCGVCLWPRWSRRHAHAGAFASSCAHRRGARLQPPTPHAARGTRASAAAAGRCSVGGRPMRRLRCTPLLLPLLQTLIRECR